MKIDSKYKKSCTPYDDLCRLKCNNWWKCSTCSKARTCGLKDMPEEMRCWMMKTELDAKLSAIGRVVKKSDIEYQNPDYEKIMVTKF